MKETLAAGLLLLTGWQGEEPLVDPACGAGTIPIEAALIAGEIAPGSLGRPFGFQKLHGFDRGKWESLLTEAREEAREASRRAKAVRIEGSDISPEAVSGAIRNAANAKVSERILFSAKSIRFFSPGEGPGTILCNPPYGARLPGGAEAEAFYRETGGSAEEKVPRLDGVRPVGKSRPHPVPGPQGVAQVSGDERPHRLPPAEIRSLLTVNTSMGAKVHTEAVEGAVARTRKYFIVLCVLFAALAAISLVQDIHRIRQDRYLLAVSTGKVLFRTIVATRSWNAGHGGVYVPVTETMRPNPYLISSDRDVRTVRGRELTKVNPAYMTRLVAEILERDGYVVHITSLQGRCVPETSRANGNGAP